MPAVMFRGHVGVCEWGVGGGVQEESNGLALNGPIFSPVTWLHNTWDLP